MLAISSEAGWPQAAPPPTLGLQSPAQQPLPPQPGPQQIAPAPPRDENPGLINEIGKLFEKSKSLLPPLKSPSETLEELNAGIKDNGGGLSSLARPSIMVSGRAACLVSSNGAPDCKKCSPKVYLPGYKRQPGDCKTENYVTRALCQ